MGEYPYGLHLDVDKDTYHPGDPTHPGPTLATANRLRELVRLIGPQWDVLGMLDAVLYDWEPRLAALVPPIPQMPGLGHGQDGADGEGRYPPSLESVQTPSQPRPVGGLVFGDEPYRIKPRKTRRSGR